MKMDEGLDTGDVFVEEKVKIDDTTTFFSLYEELSSLSAKIICENIEKVINNEIFAKKQSSENESYANKILKDYMLKGYTVNQKRLDYLEKTIKLIDIANRIDERLEN